MFYLLKITSPKAWLQYKLFINSESGKINKYEFLNVTIVTKVLIFDMDETLIHCVDDIETDDPDVVLEIDFPDEEMVYVITPIYLSN